MEFLHQNRSSWNQFSTLRLGSTSLRSSTDSGMRFSVLTLSYTITLQSSNMEQPPKNTRCLARLFAPSALCCLNWVWLALLKTWPGFEMGHTYRVSGWHFQRQQSGIDLPHGKRLLVAKRQDLKTCPSTSPSHSDRTAQQEKRT